ncbi:hypothetical protein DICVIV_13488 [Dictyocaulus viviparus]|uniref:TNFR-Cys domain-containing protein n=1 Tax=Dictyocaulus viviparus TaxID=29172 RepID=A0A0D8XA90_DICVI|nr:hypothetical protein DICVIV_13488 [Dictyocaulus viviparus]
MIRQLPLRSIRQSYSIPNVSEAKNDEVVNLNDNNVTVHYRRRIQRGKQNIHYEPSAKYSLCTFSKYISAYSDDIPYLCPKGKYFNEEIGECSYCTECKYNYFESHKCAQYKDTACTWCGTKRVEKSLDYILKCVGKLHRIMSDDKKFESKFREKVMDSIILLDEKKSSNEVIDDVEQLPDRRRLPPLPNDNDYEDQEYYDDENIVTSKYGIAGSEEDLFNKEIIITRNIDAVYRKNFNDEKKSEVHSVYTMKTHEERTVACCMIMGYCSVEQTVRLVETELIDDKVQPVDINEAAIGQENEFVKDDDELLQNGDHIKIVAIAYRDKQSNDALDNYVTTTSYTSLCHTVREIIYNIILSENTLVDMGIYLYLVSFIVLLGILLKRCFKIDKRVPAMNFTEDQRAMIYRCAHNLTKKEKEKNEAIYDNDVAYV